MEKTSSIKNTLIIAIIIFLSPTLLSQGFGESHKLNSDWSFHLGDIRYGGRESLDHSKWRVLNLPHDWSVEGIASPDLSSCTGYLPGGIAWYRKKIEIPQEKKGQQVYIYFEGVYNNSEVFINGKWLGKRPNGYISFMYDLTPYLNFGGENVIAVKVDHSDEADSRWYTGSGIYRDVHLVFANPIHIDLWGVFCHSKLDNNTASITIETQIVNTKYSNSASENITVENELFDNSGKSVAVSSVESIVEDQSLVKQSFTVENPNLWSIESPNLYKLVTRVKKEDKVIDQTETTTGFRQLNFDPNTGFSLNGKSTKFKGVCIHHDAGCLGSAVPKEVWERRLKELKGLGCNAIRTSHNPQATDIYDLCDELGFIVMDEAFDEWEYPKKKWIEGWNYSTPGFQGSAHYFREWGKYDLADMIRRDRNHPSIIMWSIGNEVDYPNDPYSHPILDEASIGQQHVQGYRTSQPNANRLGEIAKELVDVVKKNDTTRPVTAALAGAVMSNYTKYPFVLDVVGYNYTEDRYKMDHEKYPDRVLYGSENRSDFNAWRSVTENDFIMGQFIWTGFDYLGEAGRWPSRGFTTGLIDLAGYVKPQGYFRKALWSEEPVAYIGTYVEKNASNEPLIYAPAVWNYNKGQNVRVVCYTNCEKAELLLNGKKVGKQKKFNQETGIIYWDIPYESGKLEVKAYMKESVKATASIETVGLPVKIIAKSDLKSFSKPDQVAHVEISLVDEHNRVVPFADNELRFELSSNLRLLGTENGSGNPADNYKDWKHRCNRGRLLLYVQSKDGSSNGTVSINSPLFEDVKLKF